jgi:hypothetical protein
MSLKEWQETFETKLSEWRQAPSSADVEDPLNGELRPILAHDGKIKYIELFSRVDKGKDAEENHFVLAPVQGDQDSTQTSVLQEESSIQYRSTVVCVANRNILYFIKL